MTTTTDTSKAERPVTATDETRAEYSRYVDELAVFTDSAPQPFDVWLAHYHHDTIVENLTAEVVPISSTTDLRTDAEWWADQQREQDARAAQDGLTDTEYLTRLLRQISDTNDRIAAMRSELRNGPDADAVVVPFVRR